MFTIKENMRFFKGAPVGTTHKSGVVWYKLYENKLLVWDSETKIWGSKYTLPLCCLYSNISIINRYREQEKYFFTEYLYTL